MKITRVWAAGLALIGSVAAIGAEPSADAKAAYLKSVKQERAYRVERLTAADGWLTLIGLHFLKPGESSLGSAKDNDIVLAAGPAHLGSVILTKDNAVKISLNPAANALIDGKSLFAAELDDGAHGKPTLVTVDSISFFVIDRGGKKALRVKDSEAARRKNFLGIDYFPIDPSWRIEAKWVPFEPAREIRIKNILGQESPAVVLGKAVFERDGKTYELTPIQETPDEPLFFIMSDRTSGTETYGAARFLYSEFPANGKVILDFNRAVNPPCAFTPFATCPLPPKENRLDLAVTAGEKKYRGSEE